MSDTLTKFFASATSKASAELTTALLLLPEDKRGWSPGGKGRTALDQVAECVVLNGYTASLIESRQWQSAWIDLYPEEKTQAARDPEALRIRLSESTQRVIAALSSVPEDALGDEITLPWGKKTLAEIVAQSYWNMTYHLGQINYLASMLGSLD